VLEYQGDGWYELKSNNNPALNLEASRWQHSQRDGDRSR
jgi:hypothetical protein